MQQTREIEVSPPWAQHIFAGRKKVEMRKNNPASWGSVAPGDLLLVKEKGTEVVRLFRVEATRTYPTLEDCFLGEGVANLLPGKSTVAEAEDVYLGFDGSDPGIIAQRRAEFAEFGCIAIQLKSIL